MGGCDRIAKNEVVDVAFGVSKVEAKNLRKFSTLKTEYDKGLIGWFVEVATSSD